MRIAIAGPPKTGNVWLKCLLAAIYDLRPLGPKLSPARPEFDVFRAWVAAGGFRDGSVFHQHYDYSPALADAIAAVPARIVTIVRDPYDAFVSSYFTIQQRAASGTLGGEDDGKVTRAVVMAGKPLDHPDVLAYLADGFDRHLVKANDWVHSGRATVLRYEALHGDPVAELTRATAEIGGEPAPPERIAAAVESCSAERMRQLGANKAKHVRTATVGDSRQRLGEAHLAILREQHADLIRALGYPVR